MAPPTCTSAAGKIISIYPPSRWPERSRFADTLGDARTEIDWLTARGYVFTDSLRLGAYCELFYTHFASRQVVRLRFRPRKGKPRWRYQVFGRDEVDAEWVPFGVPSETEPRRKSDAYIEARSCCKYVAVHPTLSWESTALQAPPCPEPPVYPVGSGLECF